jgi:hypothetical protein
VNVELTQALAPRVRIVQFIVVALALSTVAMMGVAFALAPPRAAEAQDLPIISYVALALVPLHFVMSLVVSWGMTHAARKIIANGEFVLSQQAAAVQQVRDLVDRFGQRGWFIALFQTRVIVLAAIVEMAACINVVAYFLEHQTFSLIAAGVLAVILLFQMPTLNGAAQWVEDQGRRLDDERRLSGTPHTERQIPAA